MMKNHPIFIYVLWSVLLAIVLSMCFFISSRSSQDQSENFPTQSSDIQKTKSEYAMPPAAIEQFMLMTANPKLGLRTPKKMIEVRREVKAGKYQRLKKADLSPWEERGPNNVGGRTRTTLIDANDSTGNTVWAGSVSGGLWKTENFLSESTTWSPVNDFFQNIAISSIVQDPSNPDVIYFGTGEGWSNLDAVRGLGIWKTEDGGLNWNQLPSTNIWDFNYVQKIVIDQQGTVYACTRNNGVQRSVNGGISWIKILGGGTGGAFSDRAADIEIATNNDLYVSLGIFSSDGIYKSVDGGNSWISLINLAPNNGLPESGFERIELATAPSNAQVVYALFQDDESNDCKGIYRTDDGGQSWIALSVPNGFTDEDFTRGQAWYDLIAKVDPVNELTVYIGAIDLLRSSDGGVSWTIISHWWGGGGYPNVHADQHSIDIYPGTNLQGIVGNDGGVYVMQIDTNKVEAQPYCQVDHRDTFTDYITNVSLNTISNSSEAGTSTNVAGYSDYTHISTTLLPNQTYEISFSTNTSFDVSRAGAWIDWNGNYEFEDDEQILNISGVQPYQANFTVPGNAAHKTVRLRVRMQYGESYVQHPCAYSGWNAGETEDYSISIDNCFEGNLCDDGDACTVNDTLDSLCNCVGTFLDLNEDDICDYLPSPDFEIKNNNYNVTQFYSGAMHPTAGSNMMLGGTQDNGTQFFNNAGINSTVEVTGGDGGFCFIDQDEPQIQISTYIYNNIRITNNTWEDIEWISIGEDAGYFINPMDYDSDSNTLVASYHGGYLSRIRDVGSQNLVDTLMISELDSLKISAVKFDPNVTNRVWIASIKGNRNDLYRAKIIALDNIDEASPKIADVFEITDEQFENYAYTRSIDICDQNPGRMIVAFSNWGIPNLWYTNDLGKTWVNVDGNLPDLPVFWVLFNPLEKAGAIIATEMGIWSTDKLDGENTIWEVTNEGLANVRVDMLKYRPSDNMLLAATHGRGFFTTTLSTNCDDLELSAEISHVTCNGEANGALLFNDESYSYQWSTGDIGPGITELSVGNYHVTISTADSCHYVQTYTIESSPGIQITGMEVSHVSCHNSDDGSISISAVGGSGELTYDWDNGLTGGQIFDLPPGTFEVTITDQNNCIIVQSVVITTPDTFSASVEQISDFQALTKVSGGTAPYTYIWSHDDNQTTSLAESLSPGNISVTVTDFNGCEAVVTTEIVQGNTETNNVFDVIASAGQSYSSSNLKVDWTIGEMLIAHRFNSVLNIGEGFHQYFGENQTQDDLPDLIVSSIQPEDSVAYIGDNFFRISFSLTNIGMAPLSEALYSRVYLSTDTLLDDSDKELAQNIIFNLAPDSSTSVIAFVNIDSSFTAGTNYILVRANDNGNVSESNSENNIGFVPITIIDPEETGPDLEVLNYFILDTFFFPGDFVRDRVIIHARNIGNEATPADFAGLYLSQDEIIDPLDHIAGFFTIRALQPGEVDTVVVDVNIGSSIETGKYNLIFCLDEFESITEMREDNNCGSRQITVSDEGDRPDLIVSDMSLDYAAYFPGDRPVANVSFQNIGNATAYSGFTEHKMYLSEDTIPSQEELLRRFFTFEDFAPNQTVFDEVWIAFDKALAPGNYFIITEVDSENDVIEKNDDNNLFFAPIAIRDTTMSPDLTITSSSINNSLEIGGVVESTTSISNIGSFEVIESLVGVYLTKDDTLGTNAIRIGEFDVPPLDAGASIQLNSSIDIPDNIDAGEWNVLYAADPFFQLYESDEENNIFKIEDANIGIGSIALPSREKTNNVGIYPNPTNGNLYLNMTRQYDFKYEIINPNGAKMADGVVRNNQLSTDNLSPGLYWLLLRDQKGELQILRFVKMQ